MLKWFSLSGISKEIKRVRWPKTEDLMNHTTEVVMICVFFGVFFVASEFFITLILRLIGIGA